MVEITREEAWRRWNSAIKTKREAVERATCILVEDFERRNGVKPKSINVW